jgi:signal transduction histidine kinase
MAPLCTVGRVQLNRRQTQIRDAVLWVVLGGMAALESSIRVDPWWVVVGGPLVLGLAVRLHRDHPLVAVGMSTALVVLSLERTLGNGGVPIAYVPAMSVLCYLAGRRAGLVRSFLLLVLVALMFLLFLALIFRRDVPGPDIVLNWLLVALMSLVFTVLPWFGGRYQAQRAMLISAGWERAERIEREQRNGLDEARLRERSRIAEDMHDSVGHELSLIALRAAALEVDAELPERHREAVTELRQAAASATERLGEIIGVLRDADAEAPTQPSHESVAELVDRAAASGLEVHLVQEGTAELSPMADRAVHRVVQEALTNATKHAPGAAVSVTVVRRDEKVEVRVVNGPPARSAEATSGGHGLVGLAERLRLVGGTLTTGTRPDGGFEVIARMPRAGGRPEPESGSREPQLSGAAHELATVRRTARRGLVTAILAPLLLGALLGAVALGYYLVVGYNAVLKPADYNNLQLGQLRDGVDPVLPPLEMLDPPAERNVPFPAGATCEFYRPRGPFSGTYAYRLCFLDDRLVSTDAIQTGSTPMDRQLHEDEREGVPR